MKLTMESVTIDCAEPRALAEFWTQALDLEVAFDADGYFMSLRSRTNPSQPAIGLQKVPEDKATKNRVHIDFMTDDPDGEIARLVALGAVTGDKHEVPGLTWTVLADPAGNEFCVGTPLAG